MTLMDMARWVIYLSLIFLLRINQQKCVPTSGTTHWVKCLNHDREILGPVLGHLNVSVRQ